MLSPGLKQPHLNFFTKLSVGLGLKRNFELNIDSNKMPCSAYDTRCVPPCPEDLKNRLSAA